jgi:hypothetical protein
MGQDLIESEFPPVAAGFFPNQASPGIANLKTLGVSGVIHPGVGLWQVTLGNGVGAGTYLFHANANGVGVGQLSFTIQDTSDTVKQIQCFNIGANQDMSFTWWIKRILFS